MRILFLSSVYPTPRAPTKGVFNAALVAGLHLAGDDVRVVAPIPWTDRLRRRRTGTPSDGVHHPTWYYPPKFGHASHHKWMRRTVIPAAMEMADDWAPDIVIGYWTHPDGTVALEVAQRFGVPSVLIVGGSDVQLLVANAARREVIITTLLGANRVLAVGAPLRDAVLALGVPANRVDTFARGVDRQRFAPGDANAARRTLGLPINRPIALWVGRMVPVKGLDVLLAAWADVWTDPSAPLLLLAGDGEERATLELAAAKFGDSVRFVGPQAHAALPPWYRAADLVVLPSRSEGTPNVLLEGLACGTPFVASDVGAVHTLLEPASRMTPVGDVHSLALALRQSLSGPPLAGTANSDHVPDRREATASLRSVLAGALAGGKVPTP